MNRLTNKTATNYQAGFTYTLSGQRKTMSDVSGLTTYEYDVRDRLITNTAPAGKLIYGYDANGSVMYRQLPDQCFGKWKCCRLLSVRRRGQLAKNEVWQWVSKTSGYTTTLFLVNTHNPSGYIQVLEELQISGTTTNLTRAYTYGLAIINQRLIGTSTNYYGTDGHGNVRFLLSTNAVITDTYNYDAYGILISSTGSTPNNYRYCTEQFDVELGMYYVRARYPYGADFNGALYGLETMGLEELFCLVRVRHME